MERPGEISPLALATVQWTTTARRRLRQFWLSYQDIWERERGRGESKKEEEVLLWTKFWALGGKKRDRRLSSFDG